MLLKLIAPGHVWVCVCSTANPNPSLCLLCFTMRGPWAANEQVAEAGVTGQSKWML